MKNNLISPFKYWPQAAVAFLVISACIGYQYFAYYSTHCDDAYVNAYVIAIDSLTNGIVAQTYVQDNQYVTKGQKIIALDRVLLSNHQAPEQKSIIPDIHQPSAALKPYIIYAPAEGYLTNFNLYPGQYIRQGGAIAALVATQQWWITARYRETALRLIKIGDKATIKINMYPNKVFHGHVVSIGWGINRVKKGDGVSSPLAFSEATEDWVNIAQRFPVRIAIDDVVAKYPLRVGASAAVTNLQSIT